jgi:hypothetical protein
MKCQNCRHIFRGNFCHNCGQKSNTNRIDSQHVIFDLPNSLFQINSGILYTIKNLFTRPGESINEFIEGKRKNHFKPIAFLFITSTIFLLINSLTNQDKFAIGNFSFIQHFFEPFQTGWQEAALSEGTNAPYPNPMIWISKNFTYFFMFLVPIFSLASYLIFKKSKFNYFEHVVLNSYITGQQMVIYSIMVLLAFSIGIQDSQFFYTLTWFVGFTYLFWAYQQFFRNYKPFKKALLFLLTDVLYIFFLFLFLYGIFRLSAYFSVY